MPRAKYMNLIDKSVDAALAAIEIYNKPDFRYREEAFAILMLNAWELLLKAKIVKAESQRAIEIWKPKTRKDGSPGKHHEPMTNRSGNTLTIGVRACWGRVHAYPTDGIDSRCISNLEILMEIRDIAVHLNHLGLGLAKRIQEVGTASLKNFYHCADVWFAVDLSKYNFFLMPLAFQSPSEAISSIVNESRPEAKRLLGFIAERDVKHTMDEKQDFNVCMEVEVRFVKTKDPAAIIVQQGAAKDAIKIALTEEEMNERWRWNYPTLLQRARKRYSDFLQNGNFHTIMAGLEKDENLCRRRYLDPTTKSGTVKKFYSPNILAELDKHYTKN